MANDIDRDELNPYAAPRSDVSPVRADLPKDDQAEAIRREHIMQEASIRSLGVLFYLGAFFTGLGSIFVLIGAFGGQFEGMDAPEGGTGIMIGVGVLYVALTALYVALGKGLRGLRSWARWTTVVLTSLGLLSVLLNAVVAMLMNPVAGILVLVFGSLIPAYIIYLMVSAKASMIFSPQYKEIIALTPHVRPRTSRVAWALLIILVLFIVGIIIAAMAGSSS